MIKIKTDDDGAILIDLHGAETIRLTREGARELGKGLLLHLALDERLKRRRYHKEWCIDLDRELLKRGLSV